MKKEICGHGRFIKCKEECDGGGKRRHGRRNEESCREKAQRGTENNVTDQMRERLMRRINKIVISYPSNEGGQSQ